ncbi:MAG TPA: glycosyltransferase family A protein [Gaiellaceae bacterium]|nr:glycosyltransferase family A protein [Gaiellaceae bacterium]
MVVAVYNGERFLREALESVFRQTYDSYEVVLVDDGSTDRTAEIARDFPVRYVRQSNQGSSVARNVGVAASRGGLIAFLDHDDVLPRDKLSLQAGFLMDRPDVDCVLGRQEWIVEGGQEPPDLPRDPLFGDPGGIALGSAMLRVEALEAVGGFDARYLYAEDRDLFVRLREHGMAIAVLPETVLYRRLHGHNKTLSPPASHPLLRSLREKLERERSSERR